MDCVRYPLLLHLVLLYQVMPLLIHGDSQEKSDSVYRRHISRRSVLDIAFTLWCYKNRYRFSIYQVNGYGCYCGRGGDGIPLDEFDRCCFKHDCCYDRALHTSCWKGTSIYLKPNYSQCKLGRAECPEWSDPCSSDLCLCDKQFGECLAIATFHHKYSKYHHKLCSEPKQKCPQEEKINLEADTRK